MKLEVKTNHFVVDMTVNENSPFHAAVCRLVESHLEPSGDSVVSVNGHHVGTKDFPAFVKAMATLEDLSPQTNDEIGFAALTREICEYWLDIFEPSENPTRVEPVSSKRPGGEEPTSENVDPPTSENVDPPKKEGPPVRKMGDPRPAPKRKTTPMAGGALHKSRVLAKLRKLS